MEADKQALGRMSELLGPWFTICAKCGRNRDGEEGCGGIWAVCQMQSANQKDFKAFDCFMHLKKGLVWCSLDAGATDDVKLTLARAVPNRNRLYVH